MAKKKSNKKVKSLLTSKLKYKRLIKKPTTRTMIINVPKETEKIVTPYFKQAVEEDRRQFFFGE